MTEKVRKQDSKYVHQDVYGVEKDAQANACSAKHTPLDLRLGILEKRMDSFDKKVTATLCFGILTLITIILAIIGKVF
jgi:hypothetical protein